MSTGKEIEIVVGKTLKLRNVVSKEIGQLDYNEMQKTMHMFSSYMRSKRLTPYGPTITHARVSFENGRLIQRSRIMVQVREIPERTEAPYSFDESIRVENCVMARYRGDAVSVQMAHGKINVFAFENDIRLKGDTYTVFVEQTPDGTILADVFAEIDT